MGISGHMLGERKLRQLRDRTGLPLARVYRPAGSECEGVTWNSDGTCTHYAINYRTGEHAPMDTPFHWSSCPCPNRFRRRIITWMESNDLARLGASLAHDARDDA